MIMVLFFSDCNSILGKSDPKRLYSYLFTFTEGGWGSPPASTRISWPIGEPGTDGTGQVTFSGKSGRNRSSCVSPATPEPGSDEDRYFWFRFVYLQAINRLVQHLLKQISVWSDALDARGEICGLIDPIFLQEGPVMAHNGQDIVQPLW